MFQFAIGLNEASPLEEIVLLTEHDGRLGRLADHHIDHLQTCADDTEWALLSVRR